MSHSNGRKTMFVTGAASGIGRATATLFFEKGCFVGCYDVNGPGLDELKSQFGADSGLFHRLDVTDRQAVSDAIQSFSDATNGEFDILFNNAGIDGSGLFEDMAWETIVGLVNVNLLGGLDLIQKAIPLLKSTKNSLCISTASGAAIFGVAGLAVYSATKHAVKGFTEALSAELAPHGVRVSDVVPGLIETGMTSPELKRIAPNKGIWRLMQPRSIAETVWKAYSDDKVHYYMPEELAQFELDVTARPEATRDRIVAGKLLDGE